MFMTKMLSMKVPFLDLRVPQEERDEILEAVNKVLQHGRLILGPEVSQIEQAVAEYCNRKYAVGMNSGTDALFLALKALNIGADDEVITTCLSWIATTNSIAMTGATPVFTDISDDLNIDVKQIEKLITPKTKAIVPVHYTGKICNMDELEKIAKKHNLIIIEDAAQAFGAHYHNKKAGSFGDIACFSMNPMKIFAACGEAGMVLTDSLEIYEKLQALRYNGTINKEQCIATSLNGRLDTLQGAILQVRLPKVESHIEKRRFVANYYSTHLHEYVEVPQESPSCRDIYYTYTIRTPRRDELMAFLGENGIETKIQYKQLMCHQEVYRKYLRLPVPNGERLTKEVLCLPMHEKLTIEELEHVVACFKEFFQ